MSANGTTVNETTMEADGRFRTERFEGLERVGTIEGKWQVRGNAIAWTYLVPKADADDVNPLVEADRDRFVLTETDGSRSTFFRKGVADPLSPSLMPIAIGAGWVLQDTAGEMAMRVSVREAFAGQDCYRIDWIEGPVVYQTEYWALRDDGIWVYGRRVFGLELVFKEPYRLLGRTATLGDRWAANVSAPPLMQAGSIVVGPEENVTTPAGEFRAVRITLEADDGTIRRWYAQGEGLVREESARRLGDGEERMNLKNLKRRIR